MEEEDFYWDEINECYFSTLKLNNNVARIYFARNFGSIKKEKYLGWIWNIGLAIGKKKEIKDWYFSAAPSSISNLPTYNEYGIKVLLWAKQKILEFIDFKCNNSRNIIAVGAEDKRRWRVYEKALKKIGFNPKTVKYGYNYDFIGDYMGENDFYYSKELVYISKK